MKTRPLTAIRSLSAMVERVERAPRTRVVVATKCHATFPPGPCGAVGSVTNARLPVSSPAAGRVRTARSVVTPGPAAVARGAPDGSETSHWVAPVARVLLSFAP